MLAAVACVSGSNSGRPWASKLTPKPSRSFRSAVSPIATTHPLPFYAAGIMLASLALREGWAAGEDVGLPPAASPTAQTAAPGPASG